jgi:hypothetical protein
MLVAVEDCARARLDPRPLMLRPPHNQLRFWIQVLELLFASVVVGLWLGGFRRAAQIAPTEIRPVLGLAYVVQVAPPTWPLISTPDSSDAPFQSRMNVYEDGTRLGPPHAQQSVIGEQGGGAYLHWQESLIFSTSDNSDPRTNGRAYSISDRVHLSKVIGIPALIFALTMLPGILGYIQRRPWPLAGRFYGRAGLRWAVRSFLAWRHRHVFVKGFVLLLAGTAIALWLGGVRREVGIAPANIHPDTKLAFVVDVAPPAWPFVSAPDSSDAPFQSQLNVYENGVRLGPAHALHENIRELGGGAYSHWGRGVLFSTGDNSDPRSNARNYATSEPIYLSAVIGIPALIIVLFFLRAAIRNIRSGRSPLVEEFYRRSGLQWTVQKVLPWRDRILITIMASAALALPLIIILHNWIVASTLNGAVAGFFQVSDAAGHFSCANSLIDLGTFSLNWCDRRPVYGSLLASLLAIGGRNFHVALLLQGALVGGALLVLTREVLRFAGVLGAALALTLLLYYATENVFSLTLTENAGLAFGAVALALLLRGAESAGRASCFFGIALMSVALNARAGPMFVLPMLVVWAGLRAYIGKKSVGAAVLWAVAAVAVGFAVEFALIAANGAPLDQAHSNFSTVIYGLSVGGKNWPQIYLDHPEINSLAENEAARKIYALAFDNILHHPGQFVGVLATNLVTYLRQGLDLGTTSFAPLSGMTFWFWLLGALAAAVRIRDPRHLLIGLMAVGNLLSAPFVFHDGGPRLFAATVSVDAVLAGMGTALIAQAIAALIFEQWVPRVTRTDDKMPASRMAFGLAAVLSILVVLPYTPLRRFAALPPLAAPPCPEGEITLSARLGRGSVAMMILEGDNTQVYPPRIAAKTFRRGLDQNFYHRGDFIKEPPFSFVLAYQQQRDAPGFAVVSYVFSPTDLSAVYGRSVRICYDPAAIDLTTGLGVNFAKSVTVIDSE